MSSPPGIFARLFRSAGAMGWEVFPPSRIRRDIKAKQFLIPFKRKIWAGIKKLKENCFALLVEVRRAETRSGIIRAIFAQKRFERRSVIATKKERESCFSLVRIIN